MKRAKYLQIVRWAIHAIAALVILVTVLPFIDTDAGWIRIWDFPRPQIAVLAFVLAVLLLLAGGYRSSTGRTMLVALALAALYQVIQIWPYTPLAAPQVAGTPPASSGPCVTLVSANVHQHNRQEKGLLQIIAQRQPDLILLLETDAWWENAVDGLRRDYPLVRKEIRDNTYGLMFFSKLDGDARIRHLVTPEIPSVYAQLNLRGGRSITYYGLHPEPPLPTQSSTERDAELILVAREARNNAAPQIITGDLNDVAWSHTTRLFRQISGMVDPRIGRGLFATYHADYPPLRWALDHLFHSDDFTLSRIEVLPHIGSDHFPVYAKLCMSSQAEQRNKAPDRPSEEDRSEARKALPDAQR